MLLARAKVVGIVAYAVGDRAPRRGFFSTRLGYNQATIKISELNICHSDIEDIKLSIIFVVVYYCNQYEVKKLRRGLYSNSETLR
jgi:hypothetical protein